MRLIWLLLLISLSLRKQKHGMMEKKQPQEITFQQINDILESGNVRMPRHFSCDDFTIIENGIPTMLNILKVDTPYILDFPRLGIFVGDVHIEVNLIEHHLHGFTLAYLGENTLLQFKTEPRDVKLNGIMMSEKLMIQMMDGRLPEILNGIVKDVYMSVSEEDFFVAKNIIHTMLKLAMQGDTFSSSFRAMFAVLVYYYDDIYHRDKNKRVVRKPREAKMFEQFIRLVNDNFRKHHDLGFYASEMCITERYLGRMVKLATGKSAKSRIDKALIIESEVMLRHGEDTVSQISDTLCFPNTSFFCKYFRQHVGKTPTDYRSSV